MSLNVERALSIISMVKVSLLAVGIQELGLLEVEEDREPHFAWHHKDDVLAQEEALFRRLLFQQAVKEALGIRCIDQRCVGKVVIILVRVRVIACVGGKR